MKRKQFKVNNRYFVWRYSADDEHSNELQKGIQEYIKRYQINPYLVLVPEGLNLLPPMSGLEIKQDARVLPFRLYFALQDDDERHQ